MNIDRKGAIYKSVVSLCSVILVYTIKTNERRGRGFDVKCVWGGGSYERGGERYEALLGVTESLGFPHSFTSRVLRTLPYVNNQGRKEGEQTTTSTQCHTYIILKGAEVAQESLFGVSNGGMDLRIVPSLLEREG